MNVVWIFSTWILQWLLGPPKENNNNNPYYNTGQMMAVLLLYFYLSCVGAINTKQSFWGTLCSAIKNHCGHQKQLNWMHKMCCSAACMRLHWSIVKKCLHIYIYIICAMSISELWHWTAHKKWSAYTDCQFPLNTKCPVQEVQNAHFTIANLNTAVQKLCQCHTEHQQRYEWSEGWRKTITSAKCRKCCNG